MPANTTRIKSKRDQERVIKHIGALSLQDDKEWEITIKPHVERRSLSQNALMWRWLHTVAQHIVDFSGQDADDVHEYLKRKFIVPRRAEVNGQAFNVYSTKTMTTKEMSEYMERIYAWATSELGLLLPLPSELGRDETGRAT